MSIYILIVAGAVFLLGLGIRWSSKYAAKRKEDFTIGCLGVLLYYTLSLLAIILGVIGGIWGIVDLCG